MRLATLKIGGAEAACLRTAHGYVPLAAANARLGTDWPTDVLALLESGRLDDLRSWAAAESAALEAMRSEALRGDAARPAPLLRRPRKLWGIGLNYREHAADLDEKSPTGEPASFMKPDTAIVGPGEAVLIPRQSQKTTAEAELGLVFGRRAKDVPRERWLEAVAGFVAVIDMTAEDILRRNPRNLTQSKSFDTFISLGAELVTPDEVPDVLALNVHTVHNGRVHARNAVRNMTFPPDFLVAYHTAIWTALPGDIISTGTPGAAPVAGGDTVECRIDGFEPLVNPVRDLKSG
jgi:2-keto-4-pentenoate hydratase/2-oxohepta-3-ene-1,7-dioic acid hydratase in catechol pathway